MAPQLLPDRIRDMARACDAGLLEPPPRQAYRAALGWLDSRWIERAAGAARQPVFAQCDPNLANHLWDGHSVHLVDFVICAAGCLTSRTFPTWLRMIQRRQKRERGLRRAGSVRG
jgi:hypothetical protein